MARSFKNKKRKRRKHVSVRVLQKERKVLRAAVDTVVAKYSEIADHWGELTPQQREQVLLHSPLLRRLLNGLSGFFTGGDEWRP